MKVATIVGHLGGACKGQFEEQDHWTQTPPESSEIRATIHARVDEVFSYLAHSRDKRPLDQIERHLRGLVFALARLFLAYFLCHRHENSEKAIQPWMRRGYRREEKPKPRVLNTFFGPVRFWRWQLRPARGTGIFPLDRALGLTADAFSLLVLQTAARLSTLVTFEQVTGFFVYFLSWSPSKTSVERSVLGFGRHTSEWFDAAPAPDDDGEILVIQIDSKGTPTATDEELEKRRGKRNGRQSAPSPRHRGRDKRKRRGPAYFGQSGHPFRSKLDTDRGPSWTPPSRVAAPGVGFGCQCPGSERNACSLSLEAVGFVRVVSTSSRFAPAATSGATPNERSVRFSGRVAHRRGPCRLR